MQKSITFTTIFCLKKCYFHYDFSFKKCYFHYDTYAKKYLQQKQNKNKFHIVVTKKENYL
jgi:hypothetical protein